MQQAASRRSPQHRQQLTGCQRVRWATPSSLAARCTALSAACASPALAYATASAWYARGPGNKPPAAISESTASATPASPAFAAACNLLQRKKIDLRFYFQRLRAKADQVQTRCRRLPVIWEPLRRSLVKVPPPLLQPHGAVARPRAALRQLSGGAVCVCSRLPQFFVKVDMPLLAPQLASIPASHCSSPFCAPSGATPAATHNC